MNYCEAMNAYATNLDWICHGIIFILGFWKLVNLLNAVGRRIERWILE